MKKLRMLAQVYLVVLSLLITSCATMGQPFQSSWQPIVRLSEPRPSPLLDSETYMKRLQTYRGKHQMDLNECRAVAVQAASQVPQSSILGDTLLGGLGGAVAGTVIGAATGNPGRGAAIGATSGGVLGAGHGLWESGKEQKSQEWQFQNTYTRCMQHKGWHVQNPPKQ